MNQFFILNYIKKLTKNDIVNFASKQNISLRDDEIDVIYSYIKTRYSDFFAGREKELLLEIKEQVNHYDNVPIFNQNGNRKVNIILKQPSAKLGTQQ